MSKCAESWRTEQLAPSLSSNRASYTVTRGHASAANRRQHSIFKF